jgi:hypothetical protein
MVCEERDNCTVIVTGKLPDSGCHWSATWQVTLLCDSGQFMNGFLGGDVL